MRAMLPAVSRVAPQRSYHLRKAASQTRLLWKKRRLRVYLIEFEAYLRPTARSGDGPFFQTATFQALPELRVKLAVLMRERFLKDEAKRLMRAVQIAG